jgi:thiaminase/transcriptional activator TenA
MYQKWIDTYGGEEFDALVETVLDLTNRAYEDLNSSQRARVREAFVITSRYEWMFWDSAWRLEDWPVE